MPSEYAKSLGARLRSIRQQQGLSLQGVEEKSNGRWKAVVVGSYERGDRAVTVSRLAELADFYRVPVSELLPDGRTAVVEKAPGDSVEDAVAHLSWLPGEVVLVGSSRLAQPRRLFLGSTAAKMLHELPVPMIVVPRTRATEGESR
jgi:transcriptional regulator with XRE-family HTH domain